MEAQNTGEPWTAAPPPVISATPTMPSTSPVIPRAVRRCARNAADRSVPNSGVLELMVTE